VLGEILTNAPASPVKLNADVPAELERIVNKLLEKDKELRYQSARDVRVDLERLRRGATASTRDSVPLARERVSLVVLPFENLSPDPDNAFFADGLTEEIIADLSKVRALRVISRTSAMLLKGARKDLPTIGREMNVRYVLEGSVRRAGNQLRITAQLIEASTDAHLWADKFTGTLDDVFEIQEKLSRTIVDALKVRLTADEEALLAARDLRDAHAFDLYLQARELLYREADAVERGETLIRQAIALSGPNASLYALLGHLHFQAFDSAGRDNTGEAATWSEALELSPNCGRAVLVKALLAYKKGQMGTAISLARKAVQLADTGDALMWLSYISLMAGKVEEGRQAADTAVASDPLFWGAWVQAMVAMFEGGHERAARGMRAILETEPQQPFVMLWLAACLGYAGQSEEGARVLEEAGRATGGFWTEWSAAMALAMRGNREAAARALVSPVLLATADLHPELAWWMADAFARVGNADAALRFLARAIDLGVWNHGWWSQVNPAVAPLRNDPRFVALMERAKEKGRALDA
jgi:TolB-like protein